MSLLAFSTTITVPAQDLGLLMTTLASSGFVVLDTGERITTEDGIAGEAMLQICHIDGSGSELVAAT